MKKYLLFIYLYVFINLVYFSSINNLYAQERKLQKNIELLQQAAQKEIREKKREQSQIEETTFKSGGLSLQSLNPEISVTGDMNGYYRYKKDERERSKFSFRTLGIHFESYLDPYSRFKAAIPVNQNTAELGEAYFTRFGLLKNVNVTFGKFRQQFGVVNRWHKHGLDQFDFPLALRQVFGEGGLNQTGISFDWVMPQLGISSNELIVQITNGENTRMFGGNARSIPCILLHYKNYLDLSANTYFELGLTSLVGWNDEWQKLPGPVTEYKTKTALIYGLDITLLWEPTDRMRYRNLVWRNEIYYVDKDIIAPDGSGTDTLNPWGAYSYLQEKIARTVDIGVRLDFYQPDTKTYADTSGLSLSPLAVTKEDAQFWQVGPYITWHQSPFVKFRLEYNYKDWHTIEPVENRVILQCIFAAGPHKHERY